MQIGRFCSLALEMKSYRIISMLAIICMSIFTFKSAFAAKRTSEEGSTATQLVIFSHYESSIVEKDWINNVEVWQKRVCSHMGLKLIQKYIDAVAYINMLKDQKLTDYITKGFKTYRRYISHFHYNVSDLGSGRNFSIAIPIEGIIGLARDPRKCPNVTSEEYTQSKAYLIPLRGTVADYAAASFGTKKRSNFLFDAGATYYSDISSQGTKWIVDWYGRAGLQITNVVAWEKKPMMGDLAIRGIPDHLVHGYQFLNHPIHSEPQSVWNPLQFIKGKCRPSDFVAFKLDIDHEFTESAIVNQLSTDIEAQSLIDEFYYEQHFSNKAMIIHGWMGYTSSLADYYNFAIPLRRRGFRIHYWP